MRAGEVSAPPTSDVKLLKAFESFRSIQSHGHGQQADDWSSLLLVLHANTLPVEKLNKLNNGDACRAVQTAHQDCSPDSSQTQIVLHGVSAHQEPARSRWVSFCAAGLGHVPPTDDSAT